jgi:ubiquinone/menaquinone biosynthesis C-methylase UbiE
VKQSAEFWKDWWDDCAKKSTSDYVLNRGTTVRLSELERRSELQLINAVNAQSSDVILDAGCGSGRNLSTFSANVRQIVGVDFSAHMLARAKTRVADEKLPNVTLQQASVTELPFADNTFDKVTCISVLQYLQDEDCRAAFHELFRVCKNGGRVIVHIKNGSSLYGLSKWFANRALTLLGRRSLPEYYRRRALHQEVIRECGGNIIELDSFGIFTFVGLPRRIVPFLIRLEMTLPKWQWLKLLGVNSQLTIAVAK